MSETLKQQRPDDQGRARPRNLAPPPSRGQDRELRVGLFVILGVASTLVALFTLTDAAMFRGRYILRTTVNDAAGIRRGDPVQMRGVTIGRVQRFHILPEAVEIRLEIEGEYPVPSDSHVELKSPGLLGGTVADVVPGNSATNLKRGDELPGSVEGGIKESVTNVASSAETVLKRMQTALSEKSAENVARSSTELRALLEELRSMVGEERKALKGITESLGRSASGIEGVTTRPEIQQAITRLDGVTQRLDQTSAALNRASSSIERVLAKVERGEGTLGLLSKDDALYVNLNEATRNVNKLVEDIRQQPKRYVKLSLF